MVLNVVFVASVGLNNNTEYYKLKRTGSDLYRSRLTQYPIRRKLLDRSRYRSSVSDRCIPSQYLNGRPPGKTRLLLEEVLVRSAGGAHPVVCVGPNAPV